MPSPTNPSQTTSAQELRETAKQSRPSDKVEERTRPVSDSRGLPAPPTSPSRSSRCRSPSPSSRTGTRNTSVESRASGGHSRATTNEAEKRNDPTEIVGRSHGSLAAAMDTVEPSAVGEPTVTMIGRRTATEIGIEAGIVGIDMVIDNVGVTGIGERETVTWNCGNSVNLPIGLRQHQRRLLQLQMAEDYVLDPMSQGVVRKIL